MYPIILGQMAQLFIFVIIGWFFGKKGMIDPKQARLLSVLCTFLFLPANSFRTYSNNFTLDYVKNYWVLMALGAVLVVTNLVFAKAVSKKLGRNDYDTMVVEYSLMVPNYGYMGYALAEGLFGPVGLLNLMMLTPATTVYIYGYAYGRLTHIQGSAFKRIFNQSIIAMLIGALIGISGISMPSIVGTVASKASSCLAPISMLLAGVTISEFDLKQLVTDKTAYILTGLRLVVLPALILGLCKVLAFDQAITATLVLFYAMPCGLNPIVFSKQVGEDSRPGARYAFLSNVLSLITLPVFISLI